MNVADIYNPNPKRTELESKIKRQFHSNFNKHNPTQDRVIRPDETDELLLLIQINEEIHLLQVRTKGAK